MVATHQGAVGVHEGHAFVVEAAISVGGRNIKPGLNIYRFANRIPLLFEVGMGWGREVACGLSPRMEEHVRGWVGGYRRPCFTVVCQHGPWGVGMLALHGACSACLLRASGLAACPRCAGRL